MFFMASITAYEGRSFNLALVRLHNTYTTPVEFIDISRERDFEVWHESSLFQKLFIVQTAELCYFV